MKPIFFISLLFLVASCSLAPFASNKSGQSLGAGNSRFELGSANSNYYLKLGYGASQDLDIGYVMEFGGLSTSGIYTKYSFVNKPQGASHAMELGYGASDSTSYYYAGFISSLAFNQYLELFINPRYVSVSTDENDVDLGKTVGNVTVNDLEVNYLYLSAGMNLWLSPTFGISIYTIYLNGKDIETEEDFSSAATALFRF